MPMIRDEAVCIRHWDFSETSQTVWLFMREHGLIRGLAKGARREKGSFSGGIELLTRGEIGASLKSGRDLATLTDWNLLEIFPATARSLRGFNAAMYFADLTGSLLQEQDPHPALYDALVECLRGLQSGDQAMGRVVLRLQWAALRESGFQPIVDRDARTGKAIGMAGTLHFSASAGGLVDDTEANSRLSDIWRVRAETVAALREAEQCTGGEATAMNADATSVERANRLLAAYVRTVLHRELPTMRPLLGALEV